MGNHKEARDRAFEFFVQEAPELLQILESELLLLRTERTREHVHNLMRAAHSLKGSAANLGLTPVQNLAHRLEDYFRCFYDESLLLDPELAKLLLRCCDCLRHAVEDAIGLGALREENIAAEPLFAQIESALGTYLQTEEVLPTLGDSGIDIALTLFEVDVESALVRLEQTAALPEQPLLAGELRAQAEVFMGLGELLTFPWLTTLSQVILKALDYHPGHLNEIVTLALDHFRRAQHAVLSGQGTTGIQVAPELEHFATAAETSLPTATGIDLDASLFSAADIFSLNIEDIEALPEWHREFAASDTTASDLYLPLTSEPQDLPKEPSDPAAAVDSDPLALPEALEALLETLPELPSTIVPPPPKSSKATASPMAKVDTQASLVVRVELSRLEQMNNHLGELTILHSQQTLKYRQLETTLETLLSQADTFSKLGKHLSHSLHQGALSFKSGNQLSVHHHRADNSKRDYTVTGFDTLELDSYDEVYTLLQTVLDTMSQVEEGIRDIALFREQSSRDLDQQQQIHNTLRTELMQSRMAPLGDVLSHLPRVVRDLSYQWHKLAEVTLLGSHVLVDKAVLDKLSVPLTQLVRNAFDHGIEDPETRRQHQKLATGQISIQAYYRGGFTVIEVSDDGRGIDLKKVKQKALTLGILAPDSAHRWSSQQLLNLVFEPNFSTADTVSTISGRGIGLDIVRSHIQSLQGSIAVASQPHIGTTFTLRIPLTLRIAKLLVLWTGHALVAIPTNTVESVVVPQPEQLSQSAGQRYLNWRGQAIAIYSLASLLPYAKTVPGLKQPEDLRTLRAPTHWLPPLLIVAGGHEYYALEAAELFTEAELVIKPLSPTLPYPRYLSGCAVTGSGMLIPVVDSLAVLNQHHTQRADSRLAPPSPQPSLQVIQVIDDSLTMRQSLALTLEKAGYRVLTAQNGREALEQLQYEAGVSLITCDVEMPIMNGFEFLIQKREVVSLAAIPVLMLTSRGGDKHRQLALQLGAVGYLTKPYLDSELLSEIGLHLNSVDARVRS